MSLAEAEEKEFLALHEMVREHQNDIEIEKHKRENLQKDINNLEFRLDVSSSFFLRKLNLISSAYNRRCLDLSTDPKSDRNQIGSIRYRKNKSCSRER